MSWRAFAPAGPRTGAWLGRRAPLLLRLAGFGLLAALLASIPIPEVAVALARADLALVALGVVLLGPFFLLKSWRWKVLLESLGLSVSLGHALSLYFLGLFAGHVTPGQLGEAVKAWYLAREGHSFSASLSSIVLDRALDVIFLLLVGLAGLGVLGPRFGMAPSDALLLAGCGVAAVLISVAGGRVVIARWAEGWLGRARVAPVFSALVGLGATWSASLWLTLAAYAIHYGRYYALLRSLGADMPPLDFVVVLTLASLVALLPLSVMGIGTRDLTLVGLLGLYGIPGSVGLAFSSLVLLTFLANLGVGLVVWLASGPRDAPRVAGQTWDP